MAVVSHGGDNKTFYKTHSSCCVENALEGGMSSSLSRIKEVSNPIPDSIRRVYFLGTTPYQVLYQSGSSQKINSMLIFQIEVIQHREVGTQGIGELKE